MVAPIGKGQRGMVVSPPKAGKTTILKQIANGIIASSPDTHVIVLLVDERPEEVTDWQRTVEAAEVVYSTFDKPADQHIQVTELVLERAEAPGRDGPGTWRSCWTRSPGWPAPTTWRRRPRARSCPAASTPRALYPPKRFFGAARNIEEGGSLTIIASALVETGSRMDEVIFEEFKGTGNMELRLDRQLAEKRLFPAINVEASGTRKEELLLPTEELALVLRLRRVLHALEPGAALELLTDKIRATKSNEQFLKEIAKAPCGQLSGTPTGVRWNGLRLPWTAKRRHDMKQGIHPEYQIANVHCSCGNTFQTRSTVSEIRAEICSNCHPFYTGKQKLVDTGGRVERFQRRYAKTQAAQQAASRASRRVAEAAAAGPTAPRTHLYGGQAVVEGVMMRGADHWAVAVRRPAGDDPRRVARDRLGRQAATRSWASRSCAASSCSASRWRSACAR